MFWGYGLASNMEGLKDKNQREREIRSSREMADHSEAGFTESI
jgi:hypothetical protein